MEFYAYNRRPGIRLGTSTKDSLVRSNGALYVLVEMWWPVAGLLLLLLPAGTSTPFFPVMTSATATPRHDFGANGSARGVEFPPWPPVRLHLIEHTHDDVGWLHTIAQYCERADVLPWQPVHTPCHRASRSPRSTSALHPFPQL